MHTPKLWYLIEFNYKGLRGFFHSPHTVSVLAYSEGHARELAEETWRGRDCLAKGMAAKGVYLESQDVARNVASLYRRRCHDR